MCKRERGRDREMGHLCKDSLYFHLNFAVNLKLLYKIMSINFFKKGVERKAAIQFPFFFFLNKKHRNISYLIGP